MRTSLDEKVLDLMRAKNVKALKEFFKKNPNYSIMHLEGEERSTISDEDVKVLVSALNGNVIITQIYLRNNNIKDQGVKALAGLLEHNRSIQVLDLNYNPISSGAMQHLLSTVYQYNPTLVYLFSVRVNFEHLPPELGYFWRKICERNTFMTKNIYESSDGITLDLSNENIRDNIKHLIEALKLNIVKDLDLSSTEITAKYMRALAPALIGSTALTSLSLSGNSIYAKEGVLTVLADILLAQTHIKTLDLSHNKINILLMRTLAEALQESSIETLNLEHNLLEDHGIGLLTTILVENKSLVELNLYGNHLSLEGVRTLIEWLEHNHNVKTLELGSNFLKGAGSAAILIKKLQNTGITSLGLNLSQIGTNGFNDFVAALKTASFLKGINLAGNQLRSSEAVVLVEGLKKKNLNIERLDLSGNLIRGQGAEKIAELVECGKLRYLNLSENKITTVEVRHLIRALQSNKSLVELGLSRNNIEAPEICALAKILEQNTTLKILLLAELSMGEEGLTALIEMLKINTSIEILDLTRSSITPQGFARLVGALRDNFHIKHISIAEYEKDGDDPQVKLLYEYLARNSKLSKAEIKDKAELDDVTEAFAQELLEKYNLKLENVLGDGNCLFRAIAKQLELLNNGERIVTYDELKEIAIRYIKEHHKQFEEFLIDGESVEAYLERMLKDGEWADHNIIHALSHALQVNIVIIGNNAINTPLDVAVGQFPHTVFLGHIAEMHYVSLIPSDSSETEQNSDLHSNSTSTLDYGEAHFRWHLGVEGAPPLSGDNIHHHHFV